MFFRMPEFRIEQDLGPFAQNLYRHPEHFLQSLEGHEKEELYDADEGMNQTPKHNPTGRDAGNNNPDMPERQECKQKTPNQCKQETKDAAEGYVRILLRACVDFVAPGPQAIHAAYAVRLRKHIFKVYLQHREGSCFYLCLVKVINSDNGWQRTY